MTESAWHPIPERVRRGEWRSAAQVPRDKILAAWRFDHPKLGDDYDWGCGYPGDKVGRTRK